MLRTFMLALGVSLFSSAGCLAQVREAAPAAERGSIEKVSELKLASLEDRVEKPKPQNKVEASAATSGVGYYSTPNSDGQQLFPIEDRTNLKAHKKAMNDKADNDRRHASDR